ncbi:MAG: ACT domain-containing protein [Mycoplasmatales bacterium]
MNNFYVEVITNSNTGTISRMFSLFARRGVSIESVYSSEIEQSTLVKVVLSIHLDKSQLEVIIKQLEKLYDTVSVKLLEHIDNLYETVYVKVVNNEEIQAVIAKNNLTPLKVTTDYLLFYQTAEEQFNREFIAKFDQKQIIEVVHSVKICI